MFTLVYSRWFTMFASILIMSVNGATYLFDLYSNDIKSTLGYDQTALNLVSFFKDLGGNLGIISGLINEVTPPWVVLGIGAAMNFLGYFMIWLALAGTEPRVWRACIYGLVRIHRHLLLLDLSLRVLKTSLRVVALF